MRLRLAAGSTRRDRLAGGRSRPVLDRRRQPWRIADGAERPIERLPHSPVLESCCVRRAEEGSITMPKQPITKEKLVPPTAILDGQPRPLMSTAVVLTRHGGPEALEVRQWEVAPPGPHELRVRVEAAGISFADLLICQGLHPERRRTPHVPGWDVVGVVESVGAEVAGVSVGERAASLPIVGGWAEYAVVPGAWVVPVPATLAPTTAICLVFDYVVAYQMFLRLVADGCW